MLNRFGLTIGFALLCSGCVPMAGYYYMPAALNGSTIRHDCHGKVGALSDISFMRDGVSILVSSKYKPGSSSNLSLDIQFHLPQSDHAVVQWNDMKLYQDNGAKILFDLADDKYAYNLPLTRADLANAYAPDLSAMDGNKFSYYDVILSVTQQLPDEFILELPPMTINGISYPATNITYAKKHGVWIMPINC